MKKIIYFIIIFVSIFVLSNSINAWSKYEIGNKVTYNENDYYVIKNSDENNDTVTMLKAEPLSVEEVNTYGGVGTANNHVNMYNASSSNSYYQKAYDNNGYGGMAYYTSVDCGHGQDSNHTDTGCTTDYAQSEVKYVVDAWKAAQAPAASEARLIKYDELIDNLGYDHAIWNASYWQVNPEYTPSWVYNSNYWYWTMSQYNDSASIVWSVDSGGSFSYINVNSGVVRPVITISKSALGDTNEQEEINKDDKNNTSDNNSSKESKVAVNVPNTLQKVSIVLIMIGVILISISIIIILKNKDLHKNK